MNLDNYEVEGQISIFDLDLQFGKMYQEHSVATKEKISELSLKSWQESKKQKYQFLCLKRESGNSQERLLVMDGQLHGEHLMLNTTEYPNEDVESFLSQILQMNVQEKYYLSAKACQGILRRAEKRGKELPEILRKALEEQAKESA